MGMALKLSNKLQQELLPKLKGLQVSLVSWPILPYLDKEYVPLHSFPTIFSLVSRQLFPISLIFIGYTTYDYECCFMYMNTIAYHIASFYEGKFHKSNAPLPLQEQLL